MNTDAYIYANSRIAALESSLLSSSQLERLVSAKSADEAFLALNSTFLAPYVAGKSRSDLSRILRKSVSATKRLIAQMVPDENVFALLWLRYDFYNLKTIIKGKRAGLSNEEILDRCFHSGVFMPEQVMDAVAHDAVGELSLELGRAYEEAQQAQNVYEIDFAMNRGYFRAIHAQERIVKDVFVHNYVVRITDFFNLATQLRLKTLPIEIDAQSVFVPGGTYVLEDCATEAMILERYRKIGNDALWREAVDAFEETREFAVLEKAADDDIVQFVKSYNATIFSIVPIFGYFLAHRNNTQIVRTVIAAKESGMSEVALRRLLRRLYA